MLLEDGTQTVSDQELDSSGLVPKNLRVFLVKGSGVIKTDTTNGGDWEIGFKLKMPLKVWTDGTEDIDTTFDYISRKVTEYLPKSDMVHSSVKVNETDEGENVELKCFIKGGI